MLVNLFAPVKLASSRRCLMGLRLNAVTVKALHLVEINRPGNSPRVPASGGNRGQIARETISNFASRVRTQRLKPLYRERPAVLLDGNGNHIIGGQNNCSSNVKNRANSSRLPAMTR